MRNNVPEYPKIHKVGIRKVTRRWKDKYGQEHHRVIRKHRWEYWSEAVRRNKFTLTDERKFKIGAALNNYFIVMAT